MSDPTNQTESGAESTPKAEQAIPPVIAKIQRADEALAKFYREEEEWERQAAKKQEGESLPPKPTLEGNEDAKLGVEIDEARTETEQAVDRFYQKGDQERFAEVKSGLLTNPDRTNPKSLASAIVFARENVSSRRSWQEVKETVVTYPEVMYDGVFVETARRNLEQEVSMQGPLELASGRPEEKGSRDVVEMFARDESPVPVEVKEECKVWDGMIKGADVVRITTELSAEEINEMSGGRIKASEFTEASQRVESIGYKVSPDRFRPRDIGVVVAAMAAGKQPSERVWLESVALGAAERSIQSGNKQDLAAAIRTVVSLAEARGKTPFEMFKEVIKTPFTEQYRRVLNLPGVIRNSTLDQENRRILDTREAKKTEEQAKLKAQQEIEDRKGQEELKIKLKEETKVPQVEVQASVPAQTAVRPESGDTVSSVVPQPQPETVKETKGKSGGILSIFRR